MKEFRVTLETVTPMFLGGAEPRPTKDGKGMPELRPPSVRGAMRYWFRALIGGIYGDEEKEKIQEIERHVFGGAAEKDTSHASQVAIRIENQNLKELKKYEKIKAKNGKALFPPAGRDYLYWSMDQSGSAQKGNLLNARYYIPPESSFDLYMTFKSMVAPEIIMKYAVYSFWLAVELGGIGARSRRTAGSLSIYNGEMAYLPKSLQIGTKKNIADQLGRAISFIRETLNTEKIIPNINLPSKFDVLHPSVCKIWILGVAESSDSIVKAIGEKMQMYRSHTPVDQNKNTWLLERSVFGMPIKGLKGPERRSSPLWLKVSKVDNYYVGFATLFKSQLLPNGEKLGYEDSGGERHFKSPADYGIVENWVRKSFADAMEVVYD